eukprot:456869-Amphidinium_carterae.1
MKYSQKQTRCNFTGNTACILASELKAHKQGTACRCVQPHVHVSPQQGKPSKDLNSIKISQTKMYQYVHGMTTREIKTAWSDTLRTRSSPLRMSSSSNCRRSAK